MLVMQKQSCTTSTDLYSHTYCQCSIALAWTRVLQMQKPRSNIHTPRLRKRQPAIASLRAPKQCGAAYITNPLIQRTPQHCSSSWYVHKAWYLHTRRAIPSHVTYNHLLRVSMNTQSEKQTPRGWAAPLTKTAQ